MINRNICKFPTPSPYENPLSVSRFVRESDTEVLHTPSHHSRTRMSLFLSGEGVIVVDGARIPLSRGTLLFLFRGECSSIECTEDTTCMYIDFSGSRADELLRRFGISPERRAYDGFDGLIPIWQESLARASATAVDLAAESILLHTFSRLEPPETEYGGIVARIIEMTDERFSDPGLNLAAIAKELSYHPKYVSHLFKEKTGSPYSEYLRLVRLKYATALFDHGIDSVKNVALLSGFSDPLYFSSVFKKQVGISPREYIEKANAR